MVSVVVVVCLFVCLFLAEGGCAGVVRNWMDIWNK